jgi:hypothetical protein
MPRKARAMSSTSAVSNGASQVVDGGTLSLSLSTITGEYLRIIKSSTEIITNYTTFGRRVENTPREFTKALSYFIQVVSLSTLISKLAINVELFSGPLGEFAPIIFALLVIPASIGVHLCAIIFIKFRGKPYSLYALNLYWIGFQFFGITIAAVAARLLIYLNDGREENAFIEVVSVISYIFVF